MMRMNRMSVLDNKWAAQLSISLLVEIFFPLSATEDAAPLNRAG